MSEVSKSGRLDLFILALAKEAGKRVGQRTGIDPYPHCESILEEMITLAGIPREPIDIPMTLMRNVFKVLPEAPPRRRRRVARRAA